MGCGIAGLRGCRCCGLGRRLGGGGFVPRCRLIELCISVGLLEWSELCVGKGGTGRGEIEGLIDGSEVWEKSLLC